MKNDKRNGERQTDQKNKNATRAWIQREGNKFLKSRRAKETYFAVVLAPPLSNNYLL